VVDIPRTATAGSSPRTIRAATSALAVGPPPTGTNRRSTPPKRSALLGAWAGLTEVAEMGDAHAIEREHEDRVRAAGRPGRIVLLRRDCDDL